MNITTQEMLRRLGAGEAIESVCQAAGCSRTGFDAWWRQETAGRAVSGRGIPGAKIERDRFGIPHVLAEQEQDLWRAFGYAMAQDRLFQLDYLRRKGLGRLAEVLGPEGVAMDLVARTVGLNRIARDELEQLPKSTLDVLEAFSQGVNAWIEECQRLPIEFELLDYRPEPWSPLDSLAIENEFRWYLTGRFPVIVIPELAKRVLGDGPLYRELLLGEADDEAIIPPEAYAALPTRPREEVGPAMGDDGTGSNNWVVAGKYCRSGKPLLASDPHIAFEAVSCWYQAHLCCGDLNVAGMAYVGMPAIMFGRNERVAWGITNNICSLRDLYQERTDAAHPGCFLFDGRWEPARAVTETIQVKGAEPVERTIRFSRNGPIVDEILPPPGNETGPVALKWLGAYQGGWLTALLAMDRARTVAEFRQALRPWHVPTFNLVIADVEGQIALQSAGRIPLRKTPQRAYRRGWDPEEQWIGLLPFEAMPHAVDPQRGWMASANHRLAGDDYPYPLYGCWISGYRGLRIRQMIESGMQREKFTVENFGRMQMDSVSLRAAECVPVLVKELAGLNDPRVPEAVKELQSWDYRVEPESVPATIFNVFHTLWSKAVAAARFEGVAAELITRQAEVIAGRLLSADPHGWFRSGEREATVRRCFVQMLDLLTQRFGANMADWQWGRLHALPLKHALAGRGELATLLNHGGAPVSGDMVTVCNTGSGPEWVAASGAGYRLIADLSTNGLWAIDAQSQSGQPGTEHYSDQFAAWKSGQYHYLSLDRPLAPRDNR